MNPLSWEKLDVCLAAPSRVVQVKDGTAITECFGQFREVSLLLLGEEVAVGDYLLIQAGGFAFERIDPERAEEALALMADLMAQGDDALSWGEAP
ncbi:HypC/HybG/HupF family hydrogenase formation chaperone [Propionivibrio sp.]|uniref:HypC/HybG/HupF family hydrogenase formation chaperone n=1 Tax=Propionivibrio sp. TaxID=2212460 RepID=UPI0025D9E7DC|nr:HypC/HybG/HupF family hydrogenase formation chaperone [Propionivibrio sp.]